MEKADLTGLCKTTPVLFFTLADGNHRRSERLCEKLRETLKEKYPNIPQPKCLPFFGSLEIAEYLLDNRIDPFCAVGLFDDDKLSEKRSFFLLQRGQEKNRVSVPAWITSQWAVAINATCRDYRIRSAAYQITADFFTHLVHHAPKIPPAKKSPASSHGGMDWRKRRDERRRNEDRSYAFAHL